METSNRIEKCYLTLRLQQLQSYDFFQVVRLLQRCYGSFYSLHFKSNPQLYFPTNAIETMFVNDDHQGIVVMQNFFSLAGQQGVLPDHITEWQCQQLEAKNNSLKDFLDGFHNHLIHLYYQAWRRSHFFVNYEQRAQDKIESANPKVLTKDTTLQILHALTGLGALPSHTQSIAHETLLYYSGLFSRTMASAEGLKLICEDYFQLPFNIEQNRGRWIYLTPNQCSVLISKSLGTEACPLRLGIDTIAGQRIWHIKNDFTLVIGPLSYSKFFSLLPNQKQFNAVRDLTALYVGIEYQFSIRLVLPWDEVPPCQLRLHRGHQLGWNTWLKSETNVNIQTAVEFYPGETLPVSNQPSAKS